jgi:hypothetical protein
VGEDRVPVNRRGQRSAPILPHMQNSGRCVPAYLFAVLYAANSDGDRQLGRAVGIEGRAKRRIRALGWCVNHGRERAKLSGSACVALGGSCPSPRCGVRQVETGSFAMVITRTPGRGLARDLCPVGPDAKG